MANPQHISFPPRLQGSSLATVDQDSLMEIEQNILAVLSTKLGSRIDAPAYGVPDETFKRQPRHPTADVYLRAIEKAEPRAHVLGEARIEELIQQVTVRLSA